MSERNRLDCVVNLSCSWMQNKEKETSPLWVGCCVMFTVSQQIFVAQDPAVAAGCCTVHWEAWLPCVSCHHCNVIGYVLSWDHCHQSLFSLIAHLHKTSRWITSVNHSVITWRVYMRVPQIQTPQTRATGNSTRPRAAWVAKLRIQDVTMTKKRKSQQQNGPNISWNFIVNCKRSIRHYKNTHTHWGTCNWMKLHAKELLHGSTEQTQMMNTVGPNGFFWKISLKDFLSLQ